MGRLLMKIYKKKIGKEEFQIIRAGGFVAFVSPKGEFTIMTESDIKTGKKKLELNINGQKIQIAKKLMRKLLEEIEK